MIEINLDEDGSSESLDPTGLTAPIKLVKCHLVFLKTNKTNLQCLFTKN